MNLHDQEVSSNIAQKLRCSTKGNKVQTWYTFEMKRMAIIRIQ